MRIPTIRTITTAGTMMAMINTMTSTKIMEATTTKTTTKAIAKDLKRILRPSVISQ